MKPVAAILAVFCKVGTAEPQTVEMQRAPPAIVVKNVAGKVAASISIGKGERLVASARSLNEKFIFLAVEKHGAREC